MLVLSRKREESIQIGDDIVVKVVAIRGNVVRIGIAAPREVSIIRSDAVVTVPPPARPGPQDEDFACELEIDLGDAPA